MREILEAIAKRRDLEKTFASLEASLNEVSSSQLRPAIAASIELAQTLDLKADDKVFVAINRVWTQFCEKSPADGAFLYDAILTVVEKTDWTDAAAGTRAYKLVVAFKERHRDFFGYNTNLRISLRKNKTRLLALIDRLLKMDDRQLFTIERSIYEGRFGEVVEGLIDVFSQHGNWTGDDDLKAAAAAVVVPAVLKFPYIGNVLTVGLLQHNGDCERLLSEIIDGLVRANQPRGMLSEIAGEMMNGLGTDLAKRIPRLVKQLAPRALEWNSTGVDLFVERFFEDAFHSEKERRAALAKSKEKRALADMVLELGHDTPKVRELAQWTGKSAALKAAALKVASARPKAPAGVAFKDFNFKLLVIEALMYDKAVLKPKFDVHEFAEDHVAREIDIEKEGYRVIPEAKQYFQELAISKEQLAKVTKLVIDGGAQVYLEIIPFWDGEDDAFDLKSVDDAALLPNLKVFDFGDPTPLRKKLGPKLAARGIQVLPK